MKDVVGAILVGGASSRFGSRKEEAEIGHRSLLEYAIAAHRRVFDRVMLVGGIERSIVGTEWVPDRHQGRGPISGLHAALERAETTGARAACLSPCDAPFLRPELLTALVAFQVGVDAVVPVNSAHGRLEPMFGCYAISLLPVIENRIGSGHLSLHSLVSAAPLVRLVPDDLLLGAPARGLEFLNVNTTRDLAAARALFERGGDDS